MSLKVITIPTQTERSMVSDRPAVIGNVVILHGWGANAADAASFATLMKLPNLNLFLPEGPFPHPYSAAGRMWYGLPEPLSAFSFADDIAAQPELQTSRQLLLKFLQGLPAQTGIPLDRTILGGFSQGGAMTFDLGLALPLAGLMGLSGYLHQSLDGLTLQTKSVLMVHGTQDPVVPLAASIAAKERLTRAGATVMHHAFDHMGHEISWDVIALMKGFVQQHLGAETDG
jgi:phospholipase/carboxylesterase